MHDHAWPEMPPCVALSDTMCIAPVPSGSAYLIGWDDGTGRRKVGRIPIGPQQDPARPYWEQSGSLSDGTLTLTPSVDATGSGGPHGWVRDGKWVQ